MMPLSPELESIVYPVIEPYQDGSLQVSDLHQIYWQTYGNPEGIPVVCLHGGPGSGMSSWHARIFDPERFQIILFDQRGCGQSTPFAELTGNTTPHLISDMEQLREYLGIETWNIFGGSWGSTLALAYADQHADRVRGLVIYGIFLAREKEYQSMFTAAGPAALLYPEHYDRFLSVLPEDQRSKPIEAYQKAFSSEDKGVSQQALREWSHWEMRLLDLVPDEEMLLPENEDMEFITTHSLFEQHYFESNGFLDGDRIIVEIGAKLSGKMVEIIQGRYDLVCPPVTAYELHKAIPHSSLTMIPTAGHTAKNLGTMKEIMKAVQKFS